MSSLEAYVRLMLDGDTGTRVSDECRKKLTELLAPFVRCTCTVVDYSAPPIHAEGCPHYGSVIVDTDTGPVLYTSDSSPKASDPEKPNDVAARSELRTSDVQETTHESLNTLKGDDDAIEDSSERDHARQRRAGVPGDGVEPSRESAAVRAVGVAHEGRGGGRGAGSDGGTSGGGERVTEGAAGSRGPAAPRGLVPGEDHPDVLDGIDASLGTIASLAGEGLTPRELGDRVHKIMVIARETKRALKKWRRSEAAQPKTNSWGRVHPDADDRDLQQIAEDTIAEYGGKIDKPGILAHELAMAYEAGQQDPQPRTAEALPEPPRWAPSMAEPGILDGGAERFRCSACRTVRSISHGQCMNGECTARFVDRDRERRGERDQQGGSSVHEGSEGREAVHGHGRRDGVDSDDCAGVEDIGAVQGGRSPSVRREDGVGDQPDASLSTDGNHVATDRDGRGVASARNAWPAEQCKWEGCEKRRIDLSGYCADHPPVERETPNVGPSACWRCGGVRGVCSCESTEEAILGHVTPTEASARSSGEAGPPMWGCTTPVRCGWCDACKEVGRR